MGTISNEALAFLEEAKKGFQENSMSATWTDGKFIALRWGIFENCIKIYELGEEVGLFTEQLERIQSSIIDYDDKVRLQEIEKVANDILEKIPVTSKEGRSDYVCMVSADLIAELRKAVGR